MNYKRRALQQGALLRGTLAQGVSLLGALLGITLLLGTLARGASLLGALLRITRGITNGYISTGCANTLSAYAGVENHHCSSRGEFSSNHFWITIYVTLTTGDKGRVTTRNHARARSPESLTSFIAIRRRHLRCQRNA